jgi:hypothetical protein
MCVYCKRGKREEEEEETFPIFHARFVPEKLIMLFAKLFYSPSKTENERCVCEARAVTGRE